MTDDRANAVAAYNRSWELLDLEDRTPEQDAALLSAAFASRHHWIAAGGDEQRVVADWMVSRAAAAVGNGGLAVTFAKRALDGAAAGSYPAWLRASVQEGAARAYAAAGDADMRAVHLALASAELDQETDPDDRQVIEEQLATVPEVR
jgi:hypothetical protein